METKLKRSKGQVELVVDDAEQGRLAVLVEHEGAGCWCLSDTRLAPHQCVGAYSAMHNADAYCSSFKPRCLAEAAFVKSLLREYQELENGTILWATFNGLVRGHPDIDGYKPAKWANFDQVGYFSYKEGLERLREMREFWTAFEGDPNTVKLDNPHHQLSETDVGLKAFRARQDGRLPAPKDAPASPQSLPAAGNEFGIYRKAWYGEYAGGSAPEIFITDADHNEVAAARPKLRYGSPPSLEYQAKKNT